MYLSDSQNNSEFPNSTSQGNAPGIGPSKHASCCMGRNGWVGKGLPLRSFLFPLSIPFGHFPQSLWALQPLIPFVFFP